MKLLQNSKDRINKRCNLCMQPGLINNFIQSVLHSFRFLEIYTHFKTYLPISNYHFVKYILCFLYTLCVLVNFLLLCHPTIKAIDRRVPLGHIISGCQVHDHDKWTRNGSKQAVMMLEQELGAYILIHKHKADNFNQEWSGILITQTLPPMTFLFQQGHTSQFFLKSSTSW